MNTAALQAWPDNPECKPPVLYTGAYQGMNGSLQQSKGSGGPYSDAVSSGSGDSHLYANKEVGRANSTGSGKALLSVGSLYQDLLAITHARWFKGTLYLQAAERAVESLKVHRLRRSHFAPTLC